jgi:AcrR family transcriptional regulator
MSIDDTRQRLLEAAEQIFAEKGYEGATVREIVTRAGANIAAVNYHFGDKERLYIEAVKSAFECQRERFPLRDWPAGTPPAEKLRGFIHTMVSRMVDNSGPNWRRQLMLRELAQPSTACAAVVQELIRPDAQRLGEVLGELLPDLSPVQRNLTAFSIVGQCLFHKIAQPIIVQLVGAEEYSRYGVDLVAEHITRFSFAALGLESGPCQRPAGTRNRGDDTPRSSGRRMRAGGT